MRDAFDIGIGQFDLHAAHAGAEFARVDKQHFAGAGGFLFGKEPQAGGNLGIEEQLAGQSDHDFYYVGLDHRLADIAFAVLAGAHGAVGQHNTGAAIGLEVVKHMLQPGIVGIALWRCAIHPARVAL